jgi:hypothetical protein
MMPALLLLLSLCVGFKIKIPKPFNPIHPSALKEQTLKQQHPNLVNNLKSINDIYKNTTWHQNFFMACGGFGKPSFGCGLANTFYAEIAKKYGLPEANVKNAQAQLNECNRHYNYWRGSASKKASELGKISYSKNVCVGKWKLKVCKRVRFPGSLSSFTKNIPGKLVSPVKKAFNKLKDQYNNATNTLRSAIKTAESHRDSWKKQADKYANVLKEIDNQRKQKEKETIDKALNYVKNKIASAIKPLIKKLVQKPLEKQGGKILGLSASSLRNNLSSSLQFLQTQEKISTQTAHNYLTSKVNGHKQGVKKSLDNSGSPIDVMFDEISHRLWVSMNTCWNAAKGTMKTCVQNSLQQQLHEMTATLLYSVYLHTSDRFLYTPCSGTLADKATTKAAKPTFGLSCVAYNDLQKATHKLMFDAGKDLYTQSLAQVLRQEIKKSLDNSFKKLAADTIQPISSSLFHFRHQTSNIQKPTPPTSSDLSGRVRFRLYHYQNRFLAQSGTSGNNGVNVIAATWQNLNTFKWRLHRISGNVYKIELEHHRNRYLTQKGSGYGTQTIVADRWKGLNTQKWAIHHLGKGIYKIEVWHGQKRYLAQSGTSGASGVGVIVSGWKNLNTFRWKIEKL